MSIKAELHSVATRYNDSFTYDRRDGEGNRRVRLSVPYHSDPDIHLQGNRGFYNLSPPRVQTFR